MTEKGLQNGNSSRDKGLDALKYLCALQVICIHTGFAWQRWLMPLMHTAVPIFFMISGYYYRNTAKERRGRQIGRVFRILLLSELLYILWDFANVMMRGSGKDAVLYVWNGVAGFYLSAASWKNLLLFNITRTTHLWYLAAFLYVLILLAVFERFVDRRRLYPLIPILLVAKLLLGDYSCFLFGFSIPILYTRNFLFLGLPFFLLGDFFREQEGLLRRLATGKLIAILLLLLPFAVMENVLLRRCVGYEDKALCISAILYVGGLFLLFSRGFPVWETPLFSRMAAWGRSYTLMIYVIHIMIMQALSPLSEMAAFRVCYSHIAPLIVLALSTLAAAMLQKLFRSGKHVLRNRKADTVLR